MRLYGVVIFRDNAMRAQISPCSAAGAFADVANRPIVHHVLDALGAAGVNHVVAVASAPMAPATQACLSRWASDGISVQHVVHPEAVDVSAGLRAAASVVANAPCIVHLADGLLGEPLVAHAARLAHDGGLAISFVHRGATRGRHLDAASLRMLNLAELEPGTSEFGSAGVWMFGREAGRVVLGGSSSPALGDDLPALADRLEHAGGSLDVATVDAWRSYTGDPLDLLELNRIALDALATGVRRSCHNGNRLEGRVWIDERASVRSSVIVGPAVIGPGAVVADAYLGPYTSIGAGARVEGAEIERSIIAAGASVLHIGGRIVSSVVGRDARVFRDFSLPRALRLQVAEGTELALC